MSALVKGELGSIVGVLKMGEARDRVTAAAADVLAMDVDAKAVGELIHMLGGEERTAEWKAKEGGVGWGHWGATTVLDDLRRTAEALEPVLVDLYGVALGMRMVHKCWCK